MTTTADSTPTILFAEDVSRIWKVSVRTARRCLLELERQHGTKVVGRIGKRLYTTVSAMRLVGPECVDGDFERRLHGLEGHLGEVDAGIDELRLKLDRLTDLVLYGQAGTLRPRQAGST